MTELIKALAWPAVAIIAFFLFGGPVTRILEIVPDLLSHAESIDYSGFKISLSQSTLPQPSPEVQAAIAKMHKNDVELLLSTAANSWECDPDTKKFPNLVNTANRFTPLVAIGLADHHDALKEHGCEDGTGYILLNELGAQVKQFFISLIRAQFQNTSKD